MEFKIDTKTNYTILTPVANHLDAALTEAIRQKWTELTESGSKNLIVDLHNVVIADESAAALLGELHEAWYLEDQSLVFTNLQDSVIQTIRKQDEDNVLNIAPTFEEAVDIVSMEILERDLFGEESGLEEDEL